MDSTYNRCVPNLKTKTFSLDFHDSLLTLLKPVDSGILTVISSWLTVRCVFFLGDILFQLLQHPFVQHIATSIRTTYNPSSTLHVQIFNLFDDRNQFYS
jgi:hypothetical protein